MIKSIHSLVNGVCSQRLFLRSNLFFITILLGSLLLLGGASAYAQLKPAPVPSGAAPHPGLIVVLHAGEKNLSPSLAHVDFGLLDPLALAPVTHTFVLRNTGRKPLVIDHLQPTCGCTTLWLGANGDPKHIRIAPGEERSIRVKMDIRNIQGGSFNKRVMLYLAGQANPALTFDLAGQVKTAVSFTPQSIDFGRVPFGEAREIELTARLDRRMLAPKIPLKLICSDPDIEIRTRTARNIDSATSQVVYTLTISSRPRLGFFMGNLVYVMATNQPQNTPLTLAISPILAHASIPISVEVTGQIASFPRAVLFNTLHPGESSTQRIEIQGNTPADLEGLQVLSSSPTLTGRFVETAANSSVSANPPAPKHNEHPARTFEVSFSPGTFVGSLSADIMISTRGGQTLVIPVTVYVAAK